MTHPDELLAEYGPFTEGARYFERGTGITWRWYENSWVQSDNGGGTCGWCGETRPDHIESCPVRQLAGALANRLGES